MNLFYYATLAGIIGAIFVNGLTYLYPLLGIKVSLPWEIAANIFLNTAFIHTPIGIFLGFIATIFLSSAIALLIAFILEWTGYNKFWLKGLICADGFGFLTLGLFLNIIKVWPQIRNEPWTNLVALINLSILGIVQAYLLKRWQRNKIFN